MDSTLPNLRDKIICWNAGHTLDLCTKESTVPLFLTDSHFSQYSSHTPSFKSVISSYRPSSPILNFFRFLFEEPYPRVPKHSCHILRANKSPICSLFYILRTFTKVHIRKPRVLFALVHMLLICVFHLTSCVIVTPRYLIESTFSRTVPSTV